MPETPIEGLIDQLIGAIENDPAPTTTTRVPLKLRGKQVGWAYCRKLASPRLDRDGNDVPYEVVETELFDGTNFG